MVRRIVLDDDDDDEDADGDYAPAEAGADPEDIDGEAVPAADDDDTAAAYEPLPAAGAEAMKEEPMDEDEEDGEELAVMTDDESGSISGSDVVDDDDSGEEGEEGEVSSGGGGGGDGSGDAVARGDEDEEDIVPKKKKKKRKLELADDDYDLIEENTGAKLQRKAGDGFRRLNKQARSGPVAENEEDAAKTIEEGLFGGGDDDGADDDVAADAKPTADKDAADDINDRGSESEVAPHQTGTARPLHLRLRLIPNHLRPHLQVDDFIEYAEGERPPRRAREQGGKCTLYPVPCTEASWSRGAWTGLPPAPLSSSEPAFIGPVHAPCC